MLDKKKEEAIEKHARIVELESGEYKGYSFESQNEYGDINVKDDVKEKVIEEIRRGYAYIGDDASVHDAFYRFYFRVSELVEKNRGKLILTWPVTVRNKRLDLSKKQHQERLLQLRKQLSGKGVKLYFNPALFNLDVNFFYDTVSNTNLYGARLRSEILGN